MKPSAVCKQVGLSSLNELSEMTGKPTQTLIRWHKKDPIFFDIVLRGAVAKKQCATFIKNHKN